MSRLLIGLGTCAALGLLMQPVSAQGSGAVEPKWNGAINLEMGYTDNANDGSADFNDQAAYVLERVNLGATMELADKVSVGIEAAYYGALGDVTGASGGDSTEASAPADLYLNKGYMKLEELFVEQLDLTVGRQPMAFGLKKNEKGFGGFRDGSLVMDSAANNKAIQSFDGLRASIAATEEVAIDVYSLTYMEATPGPLSASGVDAITSTDNWGAQGVHVAYTQDSLYVHGQLDMQSGLDLAFGSHTDNGSLMTITGGAVVELMDKNLEVFGEIAIVSGQVSRASEIDASGNGLYVGANYSLNDKAYVGGEIEMASGNDDDGAESEELLTAWESREPLLIVQGEQMYDVTSNLFKIQVWGGYNFEIDGKAAEIKGTVGILNTQDDQGNGFNLNNTLATVPEESAIGNEIDVTFGYQLTTDVKVSATIAQFMASDAVGPDVDSITAIVVKTGAAF